MIIQNKFILGAIAVVLVVAGGLSYHFYFQVPHAQTPQEAGQTLEQQQAIQLAEEVGKLAVLPQGEIPIVATVSDPEKLKNQVFFKDAKVGDKVLVYNIAGKAVLYDPVAHKIVNIAPITTPSPNTTSGSATSTQAK